MEWIICSIEDNRAIKDNFDCGIPELNEYLQKYAKQNHKIGVFGVTVDALNDSAKAFYLKYGFIPLEDNEFTLFIALTKIREELT
jgi:hypothetical protein